VALDVLQSLEIKGKYISGGIKFTKICKIYSGFSKQFCGSKDGSQRDMKFNRKSLVLNKK
jgi:hypothetical protein